MSFFLPFIQAFTKTAWFIIPCLWLPIAFFLFYLSSLQFSSPYLNQTLTAKGLLGEWARTIGEGAVPRVMLPSTGGLARAGMGASIGVAVWTLLEYGFHRCE
jgi:4-hydroxysphinganine ceramide fatty acyl 2-hydroxylase